MDIFHPISIHYLYLLLIYSDIFQIFSYLLYHIYPIYDIIKNNWKDKFNIKKVSKFGNGYTMSVLIIEDYLALDNENRIDINNTALNMVNIIKEIQKLRDKFEDLEN